MGANRFGGVVEWQDRALIGVEPVSTAFIAHTNHNLTIENATIECK